MLKRRGRNLLLAAVFGSAPVCLAILVIMDYYSAPKAYRLPVLGPYVIRKSESSAPALEVRGELVGGEIVIQDVRSFAVRGETIFGVAQQGYFLVDAAHSKTPTSGVLVVQEKHKWQAALAERGVPGNVRLDTPDDIARARPDREVRPWNYIVCGGFLGLADEVWGVGVFLLAAAVNFFLGMLRVPAWRLVVWATCLGWIAGFAHHFVRLEGDMGSILGMGVLYPILCLSAAYAGRRLRDR